MAEAGRWLSWWARQVEKGYVRIGYKPHSPEQVVAGGDGSPVTPEPTPIETRCIELMAIVKRTEPDLHTVATLEYRKQGEWFERCRQNKGWRNLVTNEFVRVNNPKRRDFLKYVEAHYGVNSSRYYNILQRVKRRVADWVL